MIWQVVKTYRDAMRVINFVVGVICSLILAAIFVSIVVEIGSRNIYQISFSWVLEFAKFGLIYVVMLGGSILFYHNEHITITILPDLLTPRAATVLKLVFDVICLYFLYLVFRSGYAYALVGRGVTSGSGFVELLYPRLALPIGSALMALQVLKNAMVGAEKLLTISSTQWQQLKEESQSKKDKLVERHVNPESEDNVDMDKERRS